jgi:hypothetical protein
MLLAMPMMMAIKVVCDHSSRCRRSRIYSAGENPFQRPTLQVASRAAVTRAEEMRPRPTILKSGRLLAC